jgi:hypothetical protein
MTSSCNFLRGSLGSLEAVAGAAHGLKVARIFRVRFDFLADAADVHVDRARGHIGSIAPNGIEKMIAGENTAEVTGKVIEQTELGGGSRNGLSADGEGHSGGVDCDVSDFERAGRERALETAEHGFDAGDEFARAERLSDVVVGSDLEAEDAIGFAALGGEENYRDGSEAHGLADGAAEFEAVFAGDHDIEHEERRTLALGVGDDVGAVGIDAHGEAIVLQVMANEAGNIGIVFDDEDAWFHGSIVAGKQLLVSSCRGPEGFRGAIFIGL